MKEARSKSRGKNRFFFGLPGAEWPDTTVKRYGVAILSVSVATAIRMLLNPVLGGYAPFILFIPAIIVSSWYGGIGAALFSSVAALLVADYFFVEPFNQWSSFEARHLASGSIYLITSLMVGGLVNALRWERGRVQRQATESQRRAEKLQQEAEQRQEAERLLSEREERLRLIFENAHGVAIISFDLDGNISDWNEGAERVFGYTRDEILGKPSSMIFTPEDRASGVPEEELRIARETSSAEDDRWHLAKGDRRIYVNGVTCAKFDRHHALVGYLKIARDNTERRKVEEALQKSEWLFRRIFESAAVGIVQVDAQGRFLNANEKFCQTVGFTLPELQNRTFFDISVPEDRLNNEEFFRKVVSGEAPVYETEKRCVCKHGRIIWSEVTASFLRDERGNPQMSIAIVKDITERKNAERALREGEERLRLATESADVGLWKWDTSGGAQEWSPIARQHLGCPDRTPSSIEGFMTCVHPEDVASVRKACLESIADRSPLDIEYRVIWSDLSIHWLWAKGRFMASGQQQSNVFIGVTMDITRQKQAAKELEKAVSLFSTILESTDDGILVVDLSGKVVAYNRKFGNMWRIPPLILAEKDDQKLLKCVVDQLVDSTSFLQKVQDLMSSEEEDRDELKFKDGRVFDRYSQPHRINNELVGRVWSFHDVTARKRSEAALVRAKEQLDAHAQDLERHVAKRTDQLQKSLKDMETFLYAIAHDLRAPLRAMSSFIDLLSDEYSKQLDEAARDYCERIRSAALRMDQLISDLLLYGRLSHVHLPKQPVDLGAEIEKILKQNAHQLEEQHVAVQVDKPLPEVFADAPVLDQILENLITNAVKFVPRERIPRLHIYAKDIEDNIRLCVEDNGIGIALENQQKIFAPFQRLHTVDAYPGTGIGLAIVQRGIEKMGGHAGVDSTLGQGSCFWLDFPKRAANRE